MTNLQVVVPNVKHDLSSLAATMILLEVQYPEIAKPGVVPNNELTFELECGSKLTIDYIDSSLEIVDEEGVARVETYPSGMTASFLGSVGLTMVSLAQAGMSSEMTALEAYSETFYIGVPPVLKALGFEGKSLVEAITTPGLPRFEKDTLSVILLQDVYLEKHFPELRKEI